MQLLIAYLDKDSRNIVADYLTTTEYWKQQFRKVLRLNFEIEVIAGPLRICYRDGTSLSYNRKTRERRREINQIREIVRLLPQIDKKEQEEWHPGDLYSRFIAAKQKAEKSIRPCSSM